MAKLPREPDLAQLRGLEPTLITLSTGSELHRIYFRGGRHPTRWNVFRYFGPTASRFDHHLPDVLGNGYVQARGVMYVADHIPTSLAEVFQHQRRTIQRWRSDPWLVSFALQSDLVLLDLSRHFAVRAGASMKLMSGPTVYSRNWARGFYEVYEQACGIYYPSSLTNDPAIVLNERADRDGVFPDTPLFHRALKDPGLLTPLRIAAEELNYDIVQRLARPELLITCSQRTPSEWIQATYVGYSFRLDPGEYTARSHIRDFFTIGCISSFGWLLVIDLSAQYMTGVVPEK